MSTHYATAPEEERPVLLTVTLGCGATWEANFTIHNLIANSLPRVNPFCFFPRVIRLAVPNPRWAVVSTCFLCSLALAALATTAKAQVVISNGTILSGASEVGPFTVNAGSNFYSLNGTQFSGGTTTLGNSYVYLQGSGIALTIASDGIWTGNVQVQATGTGEGFVNNGTFTETSGVTNQIYGAGQAGFSFTNSGTVSSTNSGTLIIGNGSTDSVTNSAGGVILANGGTVYVGYSGGTVSNAGTLQANTGSTLYLGTGSNSWTNTGSILAAGGHH